MSTEFKFRREHLISPHLSRDGKSEYAIVDVETGQDLGVVYHYITDTGGAWFARTADDRPVEAEVVNGQWTEPYLDEPGAFGSLTFSTRRFAAKTLVRLLDEENA